MSTHSDIKGCGKKSNRNQRVATLVGRRRARAGESWRERARAGESWRSNGQPSKLIGKNHEEASVSLLLRLNSISGAAGFQRDQMLLSPSGSSLTLNIVGPTQVIGIFFYIYIEPVCGIDSRVHKDFSSISIF